MGSKSSTDQKTVKSNACMHIEQVLQVCEEIERNIRNGQQLREIWNKSFRVQNK